jgi:AcrR family transcriptional regulator
VRDADAHGTGTEGDVSVMVTNEMSITTVSKEPKAGRPRDSRLDGAILQATVELLEEHGYFDVSLAAIAERAGTTTPAIYRRWSSKADLVVQAVFRTEGDDVVADTGDLTADITTMVRWTVEKLCRPAGRAALVGLLGESHEELEERRADVTRVMARTSERLERAKAAGEIRPDVDTTVVVAMMSGSVLQLAVADGRRGADDAWVASVVRVLLDGIRPPVLPGGERGPVGP